MAAPKNAILSADIVASTAIDVAELSYLQQSIKDWFCLLEGNNKQGKLLFWGRIVKGDSVECYIHRPKDALRVALQLKMLVQKIQLPTATNKRKELFLDYGIRFALGVGEMKTIDKATDIMDGEAIYLAGRKLENQSTANKERIVVKNTMFFCINNKRIEAEMTAILNLIETILNKISKRQCEILYYKLLGWKDKEIASFLGISQSAVNQHCKTAGWNAINSTLEYYENFLFN